MRPNHGSRLSSLGTRLLLLLLPTVALVFAIYAAVSYRTTRLRVLDIVVADAHRTSQLIHRATHYAMLLNEKDDVQRTLQGLAEGPEVDSIEVYDKTGRAVFSSGSLADRKVLEIAEEPCTFCHAVDQVRESIPLDMEMVVPMTSGSDELLRHIDVIVNEPGCAGSACHGSPKEEKVLGLLDLRMSMKSVHGTLDQAQRQILGTALILMLLMGALAVVFVRRVVQLPVAALSQRTRRIAGGHLDTPLEVRGHHELSRLAEDFNLMTEQLDAARKEIVTWSQTLETKVVEKTEELQRAQRQVLQMDRMASLGKLSATVAHELNNPIGGILTYAKLVERGLEGEELETELRADLERYLHLIQRECSRCGDIVRNLLVFARRSGSEMREVDLKEIVERSLMLIRHHLEISGIRAELHIELEDPRIVADPGQIEQALLALLINAVEAVVDSEGELTLTVTGETDFVELVVADTGVGIESSAKARIFEPFFSTKNAESGVGLGLAVVYGIVQRHRGEIEVESELGQGTQFRIRLPRRPELDTKRGQSELQE